MNAFPTIETARLVLGKISSQDIPAIIEHAGNKKIADHTLFIPHPYEEKDAIFWINSSHQGFEDKTQYTFGLRIKTSNEFIGGIGLVINNRSNHAELGYWIGEPFWNLGYATEAVNAILKFGFEELNLNKIYAAHIVENPASGKVMVKNKMIKEALLKDHAKKGDLYYSLVQYRLTKKEFEQNH